MTDTFEMKQMISTLIQKKGLPLSIDRVPNKTSSILTRNTPLASTSNVVKELQAKKDLTIINGNSVKNLTTSNGKTVNVS
jgi:hypothetical protein